MEDIEGQEGGLPENGETNFRKDSRREEGSGIMEERLNNAQTNMVQPEYSISDRSKTASRGYGQEVCSAWQTRNIFPLGVSENCHLKMNHQTPRNIHILMTLFLPRKQVKALANEKGEKGGVLIAGFELPRSWMCGPYKLPGSSSKALP